MGSVKVKLPNYRSVRLKVYEPFLKRFNMLSVALGICIGAGSCYWGLNSELRILLLSDGQVLNDMRTTAEQVKLDNQKLAHELSKMSRLVEIERQTGRQLKDILLKKEFELAKREQELNLLSSLIAPENAALGLQIREFKLRQSPRDREFYYDLLLTQAGVSKKAAKGDIQLIIDGLVKGKPQRLTFSEIAVEKFKQVPYQFRFFQRLSGVMQLPESFEPNNIQLKLTPSGKSSKTIQTTYQWAELVSKD
jgi:hypothetical protein|tara:strand:- start:6393 stop:7142 length:750 start_codon:yes stop_codon:yes gene_type:complete